MKWLLRTAATAMVLLAAFDLMVRAFHWMNLPSDRALYGGTAMVVGLILAVPLVIHVIWRKL